MAPFWPLLAPCWSLLAPFWEHFGRSWLILQELNRIWNRSSQVGFSQRIWSQNEKEIKPTHHKECQGRRGPSECRAARGLLAWPRMPRISNAETSRGKRFGRWVYSAPAHIVPAAAPVRGSRGSAGLPQPLNVWKNSAPCWGQQRLFQLGRPGQGLARCACAGTSTSSSRAPPGETPRDSVRVRGW